MFCTSPLIAWRVRDRKHHRPFGRILLGAGGGGPAANFTLIFSWHTHTHGETDTHTHTHRHQFSFGEMSWSVDGCGRLSLTDAGLSLSPSVGSAPPSATGR